MASIRYFQEKLKQESSLKSVETLIIVLLLILIAFRLGQLESNEYSLQKESEAEVQILQQRSFAASTHSVDEITSSTVVASKNGSVFYPINDCTAYKRIKEENRIYFLSAREALGSGFTLAQVC